MDKVNLGSKLAQIHEHWQPHIAGELNGQLIKLVKFQGEFVWHHHDNEDEMFLVVKGQFRMEFRDEPSGPEGPDFSEHDSARLEAVPSQSEIAAGEGLFGSRSRRVRATQNENSAGEDAHSTPSLHSGAQGKLRPTDHEGSAGKSARATQEPATRSVTIREGEFIIVPRGIEHKPVTDEECWVMLFEPASTVNTGNVVNERTVRELKRV